MTILKQFFTEATKEEILTEVDANAKQICLLPLDTNCKELTDGKGSILINDNEPNTYGFVVRKDDDDKLDSDIALFTALSFLKMLAKSKTEITSIIISRKSFRSKKEISTITTAFKTALLLLNEYDIVDKEKNDKIINLMIFDNKK